MQPVINPNLIRLVLVLSLGIVACSLRNRTGPDVTCVDLDNGATNACAEGIIATCMVGKITFEVCDDEKACDATWQSSGRYGCTEADARAFKGEVSGSGGSSGNGGSGGSGKNSSGAGGGETFHTCGVDFKKQACAVCIGQTACCQRLTACVGNPACESCLNRPASQSQCFPDVVPLYDQVVDCLAMTCMEECQ